MEILKLQVDQTDPCNIADVKMMRQEEWAKKPQLNDNAAKSIYLLP